MAKKTKLSVQYTSDFKVFAVFSQQKDYRLCWLLNRYLHFDLKKLSPFVYVPYKKNETCLFSAYYYKDTINRLDYFLVANKCPDGVLFELPKNMDYLLLVKNPGVGFDLKTFISKLRNFDQIQGAFLLENGLGSRSDHILYDFEIYADEAMK